MDILFVLIALAMVSGVLIVPALLRRRGGRELSHGAALAADPARYGFVPAGRLDIRLPGPDGGLTDALDEISRTGDWHPAARLLSSSTGELRWQRVQALAGAAAVELTRTPGRGGAWLRSWRVDAPEDAGGAMTHAEFLIQQAWRSPRESPEFRIILEEAREVATKAASLAPGDPVPFLTELSVARGLAYRQADFESLWSKITALAPHHMGAHLAALHYWCEKWHGSRDLAYAFTHRAAAAAPEGSLLPALPLFAVAEHLPDVVLVRGFYESDVVTKAVEGALYAVRQAPAGHPVLPHVRHLLISFLVRAERYADAMEQLRAVDGHVGAVPWSYAPDPAAEYAAYRALAIAGWERTGGGQAGIPGHPPHVD